jgi:MSHA biogenesis protein MshP
MSLHPPRQSGFAAIAALFLLVVLAGMGAFMVTFSNVQQLGSAQDFQSVRSYWAARAGLEWALGALTVDATACPLPPTHYTVDTGSVFDVTIDCKLQTYLEGTVTVKIFTLQSVASSGTVGSVGFVERSVSATFEVPQ